MQSENSVEPILVTLDYTCKGPGLHKSVLYFAWEDQRQKQHFICHTMSSVLYKNTAWYLTNTVQLH